MHTPTHHMTTLPLQHWLTRTPCTPLPTCMSPTVSVNQNIRYVGDFQSNLSLSFSLFPLSASLPVCVCLCVCLGGWSCFSKQTCDHRLRSLMSSSQWPQTRKGTKYRHNSLLSSVSGDSVMILRPLVSLVSGAGRCTCTNYASIKQFTCYTLRCSVFSKHYNQCEFPCFTGAGILSPKPEENPYWWNANMV